MSKVYNTKQRRRILDYMSCTGDRPVTIKEIGDNLPDIGRSTLYRQMEILSQSGEVMRHVAENSREYVYSLGNKCTGHYHLKCSECGRIVHLDSKVSEIMEKELSDNNFEISEQSTVIVGVCHSCKECK